MALSNKPTLAHKGEFLENFYIMLTSTASAQITLII
jgi:hypothetical protein